MKPRVGEASTEVALSLHGQHKRGHRTHRALLLRGLHAARLVIPHTASRVFLFLPLGADEAVHLLVLPHAR